MTLSIPHHSNRAFLITLILSFCLSVNAQEADSVLIKRVEKLTLDLANSNIELDATKVSFDKCTTSKERVRLREQECLALKKEIETKRDRYKIERNGFRDTLAVREVTIENLESEIDNLRGVQKRLEDQYNSVEKAHTDLNIKVSKDLKAMSELSERLKQSTASNQEQADLLTQMTNDIAHAETAIKNGQNALEKSQKEHNKLATEIQENSEKIRQKELELAEKEIQIVAADSVLDQLKKSTAELDSTVQGLTDENIKLKENQKKFNDTLNFSFVLIICGLLLIVAIVFYYLLFKRSTLTDEEVGKFGDPKNILIRDVLEQMAFNRVAMRVSKAALVIEFVGILVVFGVLLTFHYGPEELSVIGLVGESTEKFIGSLGVPILFFITLYNVLDARRIELIRLLDSFKNDSNS